MDQRKPGSEFPHDLTEGARDLGREAAKEAPHVIREVVTVDVFQGKIAVPILLIDIVNLHDIGMLQLGDGPGLSLKSL